MIIREVHLTFMASKIQRCLALTNAGIENIFVVHQKTPSDSSVESSASASSENSRNSNEVHT